MKSVTEHILYGFSQNRVSEILNYGSWTAPPVKRSRLHPGIMKMQKMQQKIKYKKLPEGSFLHITETLYTKECIWNFVEYLL